MRHLVILSTIHSNYLSFIITVGRVGLTLFTKLPGSMPQILRNSFHYTRFSCWYRRRQTEARNVTRTLSLRVYLEVILYSAKGPLSMSRSVSKTMAFILHTNKLIRVLDCALCRFASGSFIHATIQFSLLDLVYFITQHCQATPSRLPIFHCICCTVLGGSYVAIRT